MKFLFRFGNLFLFLLFLPIKTDSCTIFYIEKEGIVLAGNNEDWKDNAPMVFFYPSVDGKNGWIKFGWANGFPQGGMNEHGLFWDATSGPYLAMPQSEAAKTKLLTPIMQKVIEECRTVENAKLVFGGFYCEDQYKAQYLVGDSTGHSMIVEGDNIINKKKDYQVLTNFYQSHPELGGHPCWRYDKACELLQEIDIPAPYDIGYVLASTHQDGKYPTQYSTIYDLNKQQIYLFHFHNYEEFIDINLKKELQRGYRFFHISDLFSHIQNLQPADGAQVNSEDVTINWKGKPGSFYEIIYSVAPDFSEAHVATVSDFDLKEKGGVIGAVVPVLLILIIVGTFRKKPVTILFLVLFIVSFKCSKDNVEPAKTIAFSKNIIGLESGQTYFWKIHAKTADQKAFYSETSVRQFKTQ